MRASGALEMDLKALVNYRDFHSLTQASGQQMKIDALDNGVRVVAFEGATPFYLRSSSASCEPRHEWYLGCYLGEETERGLDDHEDHLFAALFHVKLGVDSSVTLVATTEATPLPDGETARDEAANQTMKHF